MEHNEQIEDLEQFFKETVALHEANQLESACRRYAEILKIMPDSPLVNYNCGLAFFELGDFKQAYACYQEALQQAPDEKDVLYNTALCAQKLFRLAEAESLYKKILLSKPDDIDSLYNLACCFMDGNDEEAAVALFQNVLELAPEHSSALHNLACIYHRNEDFGKAEKYYSQLLRLRPDHEAARHLLAALQGDHSQQPPTQYVEELFDNYAHRYEKSLEQELEYAVPGKIRAAYDTLYNTSEKSVDILDLGCGTGLGGAAFADLGSTLVGIDLSREMLKLAAEKEIYTTLHAGDLEDFLNTCSLRFDLLLAMDVFTYMGDLHSVLTKLRKVARAGARLCFSTETGSTKDYLLKKSGRFCHGNDFIKRLCAGSGWSLVLAKSCNLRKERGSWIKGKLYIAVKNP